MGLMTPRLELCRGSYRAQQAGGHVLIYAHGVHPTSGYQTIWSEDQPRATPPQFSLWHVCPDGPVLQVITPFAVATSFQTTKELRQVTVRDDRGVHQVPVEVLPVDALSHQGAFQLGPAFVQANDTRNADSLPVPGRR